MVVFLDVLPLTEDRVHIFDQDYRFFGGSIKQFVEVEVVDVVGTVHKTN